MPMWCSACAQYLLQQFIDVQAVPKGAPVYQPPEEKQRGVFRLVRSAAGLRLLQACCCLSAEY